MELQIIDVEMNDVFDARVGPQPVRVGRRAGTVKPRIRSGHRILAETDLFFRAADRPDQMPYWVSDEALKLGTPWIDCSYAGPMINCCIYVPGLTGCYRCLRGAARERLASEGRLGSFSESPPAFNAAFGPVVHMAASLAAYEGIRFLTGLSPQTIGSSFHQNMFDYAHSYVVEVPGDCPHG
ncbi:ThiF family adenylyltransferase [Microbacterium sp. 4-7]|uniref:ThiF family adenylyltransferase n=1 Tax=Microbacterium sp. 4-7 TaxID=1885327 RepID=UPI00164EF4A9|nr:ThiF family adenylyltransferase [Microbacterium sp. 4-7]MBC6493917.1 hypothetical protein [Microbacterium sp. 4-7]